MQSGADLVAADLARVLFSAARNVCRCRWHRRGMYPGYRLKTRLKWIDHYCWRRRLLLEAASLPNISIFQVGIYFKVAAREPEGCWLHKVTSFHLNIFSEAVSSLNDCGLKYYEMLQDWVWSLKLSYSYAQRVAVGPRVLASMVKSEGWTEG